MQEKNTNTLPIRVRFAPSPTGMMHLGNVRAALMNYLFAQHAQGTFILRIEDTDQERNFDPGAKQIIADLQWLGLTYQEGPFFQSDRGALYQEKLTLLQESQSVYRCFCTLEELEKRRQRQIALKQPPRYDRTCTRLSTEEIQNKLGAGTPFIWRMKIDSTKQISFHDLAHGTMTFDLKNFSDFPITRQDGTVTFMFANAIDDIDMSITHVLRGEDHLTNTVGQTALFAALGAPLPVFWHMPIMCNTEGKKLSKRDFGFSLNDLRTAGFLPEAINNYLGILGGSFEQEILSLYELAQQINIDHIKTTGRITYDVEKLRWLNHKWITRCSPQELLARILPLLSTAYPMIHSLDQDQLLKLIQLIHNDLVTLTQSVELLKFYFIAPTVTPAEIPDGTPTPLYTIIQNNLDSLAEPALFLTTVKQACATANIPLKTLFPVLRLALTGQQHGPAIQDILTLLGQQESLRRLQDCIKRCCPKA